ncbi:MAG: tyrosine-type recombinase/integrase, partial [Bacteroidia bacterium]|nr:tyrosine-type recombinase/integrase [Bacteroidia bacterium]
KSPKTCTGLSTHSINKIINSINAFSKYINATDKHLLDITPKNLTLNTLERSILTKEEITQLYEATFTPHKHNTTAIGQRDRAIIAIFYGCGLRKDEGARLNIFDMDLHKGLVFVRKAKGNRQRYVPIAPKHLQDIKDYLEEGRDWFLKDNRNSWFIRKNVKKQNTDDEAFFISNTGKRMLSFYQRFSYLKDKSGLDKDFSTHTLRHSIATHLLQSGMKIEDIAKFLGHTSLDSTQIYTHIAKQYNSVTLSGAEGYTHIVKTQSLITHP